LSDELTTLLKISKTPTVLLINDGDVVDGIKGLANDKELELFFQSLQKLITLKEHKAMQQKMVESIYDLHEQKNYT
jgi:thioredoxin-like negative regulator of GroEL